MFATIQQWGQRLAHGKHIFHQGMAPGRDATSRIRGDLHHYLEGHAPFSNAKMTVWLVIFCKRIKVFKGSWKLSIMDV